MINKNKNYIMKKRITILGLMTFCLTVAFISCSDNDPLSEEQYKKEVYIVGAYDHIVSRELKYADEPQETFISVAISGSQLISHDVNVNLKPYNSVIDWYNNKYLFLDTDIRYQSMPTDKYSIAEYSTTIPSGQVYGRVPITVTTAGLECDSLYALTFAIESTSDYSYNTTDSALIMSFTFINDYSGTYLFSGLRNTLNSDGDITASSAMSFNRTFKAVNKNEVRFFNEQQTEIHTNIKANCLVLNVSDPNNVTLRTWEDFDLTGGTCTYDSTNKVFNIDYTCTVSGVIYQYVGTFTKQEDTEEE